MIPAKTMLILALIAQESCRIGAEAPAGEPPTCSKEEEAAGTCKLDMEAEVGGDPSLSLLQQKFKVHPLGDNNEGSLGPPRPPHPKDCEGEDCGQMSKNVEIMTLTNEDFAAEPDPAQEQESEPVTDEDEDEEEEMPSEKRFALQEMFQSLKKYTVHGREALCPAKHYLAGLKQENDTKAVADCMPCAGHCEICYGPTQSECLVCAKPMATLLTREFPKATFSCVSACPECYTLDEHNFCALNLNCSIPTEEEEVFVPLNHTSDEIKLPGEPAEPKEPKEEGLLQEPQLPEEPNEEEEEAAELEVDSEKADRSSRRRRRSFAARRRRRQRRRAVKSIPGCYVRTPSGCPRRSFNARGWKRDTWGEQHKNAKSNKHACVTTRKNDYNSWCGSSDTQMRWVKGEESEQVCQNKMVKLQEEIDLWHDECYDQKAQAVKDACDKRSEAQRKLATYKKIAKAAKAGSSWVVRSALNALGWLPWGVGKILKAISKALGLLHPRAARAETAMNNLHNRLKDPRLINACRANDRFRTKVQTGVNKAQKVLDKMQNFCGCDCLDDLVNLEPALDHSSAARDWCTSMPTISVPSFPTLSLPSIFESILNLIASLSASIASVMGIWIWIPFWGWETLGSIIRGISWALGFIDYLVENLIFGLLSAVGIPCSSMSSCLNSIIGPYIDRIPGLSFPWSMSIPSMSFPTYSGFPIGIHVSLPGCTEAAIECATASF